MTFTLRMLLRDWRGGELRLLLMAVVIAVAAVTSVSWLAERVAGATSQRAADLLAADRALEYANAIPDYWRTLADKAGLETATTAEFPSIVVTDERTRLVSVKAVTEGYPLRGRLRVQDGPDTQELITRDIPEPGTVWVEPRLLPVLGVAVGETISLGRRDFTVARLLTLEPDRGGFVFSLAPRVMMNRADLEATGLVGEGSRVRYKLLLAGPEEALDRVTVAVTEREGNAVEVETPTDERRGVAEVVTRAKRFLGLAALLTVIVAGVAVLLTVRHYAERQVTGVAVMRALGGTRRQLGRLFVGKLFWLGLIAGGIGALIGFVLHAAMLAMVADLLGRHLPPPGLRPLATGWLTAFAALFGFALPTLLRLRDVPPMRVLRRELGEGLFRGRAPLLFAAFATLALMAWQAGDAKLTVYVAGALAATLIIIGGAATVLVRTVVRLKRGRGGLLRFSGLTRRPWTAIVQITAVGTGLMALFLLAVVRNDLLDAWSDRIPEDAPNQFLINIQPEERAGVAELLADAGVTTDFYPMARGRMLQINGRAVNAADFDSDQARRLTRREFNLTTSATLQEGNEVIAGQWWNRADPEPGQVSVEREFAEETGIAIGDELTFGIAGDRVTVTVTSLREVDWDTFNVNFFMVASPGTLGDVPLTFVTSFYLADGQDRLLMGLVREYPSVTAIDVTAILRTVRAIMDDGSRVVELMSLLTLAAGILVLLAAMQITGEERRFESALLRALGATGKRVRRMARQEFWLVGALSGLVAAGIASVAGAVVARGLFDMEYPIKLLPIAAGALIGLLTVWLAGSVGARKYYRTSPMRLLREGED